MANYFEYGVNLSEGQKISLAKAIKTGSELTLRLKKNQLSGPDELLLTKTQVNKIQKAAANQLGVDIKISKSRIRKSVRAGGSLFSSLAMLGAKALPFVTKAASKALPALATGAVTALGSLGMDKMKGPSGMTHQTGLKKGPTERAERDDPPNGSKNGGRQTSHGSGVGK